MENNIVVRIAATTAIPICLYLAYKYYRIHSGKTRGSRSVSSSLAGGTRAYELSKAVDEYLDFHFGQDHRYLPFNQAPKDALNFPSKCALLCEKYCPILKDITGEYGESKCMDIGCAVGGATFQLSKCFKHVLGIDYSKAFIEAAQKLKSDRKITYTSTIEAEITEQITYYLPNDIETENIYFKIGDACNLANDLNSVDCILAANLICRLPDPMKFLNRIPSLLNKNGILVLLSPYSWLSEWTKRKNWLGGKDGIRTFDALRDVLNNLGLDLVHEEDISFIIREHLRKYQWGMTHATIWIKR